MLEPTIKAEVLCKMFPWCGFRTRKEEHLYGASNKSRDRLGIFQRGPHKKYLFELCLITSRLLTLCPLSELVKLSLFTAV